MAFRKWLVRALVFAVSGGLAAAGFLYQHWTNPSSVRRQVIDKLGTLLVGANVYLESAQMRLLGGISLHDLRLSRRDDPDKNDLVYVPAATVYPDKEQLLNGKLAIRKVELQRPHLHVWRDRTGRWSLTGIFAPPHLEEAIPTLEVRQGTIVLDDQLANPGLPPVELTDVHLLLINDPLPVVRFQGSGRSELAGTVQISGTFQRATHDAAFAVQAAGIPVGLPLLQRVKVLCPQELGEYARHLEGTANLQAEFTFAGTSRAWTHNARCQLTGGKYYHPNLPLALDDLEAAVSCIDGQLTVQSLRAHSGQTEVRLKGQAWGLDGGANLWGELTVDHLPVTTDLFDKLPEPLKESLERIHHDFRPTGPVSLVVVAKRTDGQWSKTVSIRPEDLTIVYEKFPYPLEHVTGTIRKESDPAQCTESLQINLAGLAGAQKVFLQGGINGDPPFAAVDLKVWGANVPLDQKVQAALSPTYQRLAKSFHPTGLASFEVTIRRRQGRPEFANHFRIHFHHAAVRYDVFPYPLEDVSGTLDIQPDHWTFSNFVGTHKGGQLFVEGGCQPTPAGDRLLVRIRGDGVLLDPEMKAALDQAQLDPEVKQAWPVFNPAGRIRFTAGVDRLGAQPADVQVGIMPTGCTVKPAFFPYALDDVTGSIHYAHRWVVLTNLQARHGQAQLSLDRGWIFLKPTGGVWGKIETVQASRLTTDDDLIRALPPVLRSACETMQLAGPAHLRTDLTLATFPPDGTEPSPQIYWEGDMALEDAALHAGVPLEHVSGKAFCRGLYNGQQLGGLSGYFHLNRATLFQQPFQDVRGAVEMKKETPSTLAIHDLHARLFGGEVYGPVRVELGAKTDFELDLKAARVKLEQFGRHNLKQDGQLSGLANASLYLKGHGSDLSNLRGSGAIDVPNGRIYNNLPLLLDLLKFLAIRLPDGTAFEEAHANFKIDGDRINIDHLDLFGNSISLRGQGGMTLAGSNIEDIDLDFYAVWARVTLFLPPLIKDLPQEVSKRLLKIKMQGRVANGVSDVRFRQEPLPDLVEPFKVLLERMTGGPRPLASKEKTDGKMWDR